AEDGIRDRNVTGVQTCALPIYVQNFKAFRTNATDPTIETDGLNELQVERDEDDEQTFNVFTESEDETKSVLYSYEVNGSVEKYRSEEHTSELSHVSISYAVFCL